VAWLRRGAPQQSHPGDPWHLPFPGAGRAGPAVHRRERRKAGNARAPGRSRAGAQAPPGQLLSQLRTVGLTKRPHRGHYAAPHIRRCEDVGCHVEVSWALEEHPEKTERRAVEARLIQRHRQVTGFDPPIQHGGRGVAATLRNGHRPTRSPRRGAGDHQAPAPAAAAYLCDPGGLAPRFRLSLLHGDPAGTGRGRPGARADHTRYTAVLSARPITLPVPSPARYGPSQGGPPPSGPAEQSGTQRTGRPHGSPPGQSTHPVQKTQK